MDNIDIETKAVQIEKLQLDNFSEENVSVANESRANSLEESSFNSVANNKLPIESTTYRKKTPLQNYLEMYTQDPTLINMDNSYINNNKSQTNPYLDELRSSNVEIRKNSNSSNHSSKFATNNQKRLPQTLPPIANVYTNENLNNNNNNNNDQNYDNNENNNRYKNNIYNPEMFYDQVRSSNANTKLNSYYNGRLSNLKSSIDYTGNFCLPR